MKNFILVSLILPLFLIGCNSPQKEENQVGIITGDDFRSRAAIKFADAYVNNDLNSVADLFTPDAKIMVNDTDLTFSEMAAGFSIGHEYFTDIRHEKNNAFTMHYKEGDNAGSIFTHYWYNWKATSKKTGKELSIRGYAWMKWRGDKVEIMYNAFDPTLYNASLD